VRVPAIGKGVKSCQLTKVNFGPHGAWRRAAEEHHPGREPAALDASCYEARAAVPQADALGPAQRGVEDGGADLHALAQESPAKQKSEERRRS
jgi:hypothetical protein